jgi:dTDP-4-amino-4,6-dideoxygalactose transaminase
MLTGLTIPFTGLKKQYNHLRTEILDITDSILRSGHLMDGNYTIEFEYWLAKKNQSRYAITCHSGTQALEIIAEYQKKKFDSRQKILIPAMTFPASVNAFIRANYDVSIVDVDHRGIIDMSTVNYRYDYVLLIGLYGAGIKEYSYNIDAKIIEDAAQHWLADNCQRSGLAAALSFDPTKNLANYGNGGAIVTDDLSLSEFARNYRNNGKYSHEIAGTNSRMSEIDCAQLLVKTRYLDQWQARRKIIAKYWYEIFSKHNIKCFINEQNIQLHGLQKYVLDLDNRDTVRDKLSQRKIETRVHYSKPLFELSTYDSLHHPGFLSRASALSRRVLSLPFYPELTDLEVEYIAEQLISVYCET